MREVGGFDAPAGGVGRVARVIGPVVDVEFPPDQMPDIYNALLVDVTVGDETRTMTMEVELQIGDNIVRAIALKPTDGMQRGAEVRDTGAPISVPVGDVTKGHVWNVTGDVLNADPSTVQVDERWSIHRPPPRFDQPHEHRPPPRARRGRGRDVALGRHDAHEVGDGRVRQARRLRQLRLRQRPPRLQRRPHPSHVRGPQGVLRPPTLAPRTASRRRHDLGPGLGPGGPVVGRGESIHAFIMTPAPPPLRSTYEINVIWTGRVVREVTPDPSRARRAIPACRPDSARRPEARCSAPEPPWVETAGPRRRHRAARIGVSQHYRFRYSRDMPGALTYRSLVRDIALDHYGYVTPHDAAELGVPTV